jgi:hypothetical protein
MQIVTNGIHFTQKQTLTMQIVTNGIYFTKKQALTMQNGNK